MLSTPVEVDSYSSKTALAPNDILLLEDSQNSFAKRKVSHSEMIRTQMSVAAAHSFQPTVGLATNQAWTCVASAPPSTSGSSDPAAFVAVARDGTNRFAYSKDGVVWLSGAMPQANGYTAIVRGPDKYVVISDSGTNRVFTSVNGISSWTARTAAQANDWQDLAYGNGIYVAVSSTGANRVMTSTDGITWTARTITAKEWYRVRFGNGIFMAMALNNSGTDADILATSADGITWTIRSMPRSDDTPTIIEYGRGVWVLSVFPGTVVTNFYYSTDNGVSWTASSTPNGRLATSNCNELFYGGGIFIGSVGYSAPSHNGVWSRDGINWKVFSYPTHLAAQMAVESFTYRMGKFVGVFGGFSATNTGGIVSPSNGFDLGNTGDVD
jgi:hypothetical protein